MNEYEMLAQTENNILHANNPSFKHVRLNEFWAGWVNWVIRLDAGTFSCAYPFVSLSFFSNSFLTFAIKVEKDEKTVKRIEKKKIQWKCRRRMKSPLYRCWNAERMNEREPKERKKTCLSEVSRLEGNASAYSIYSVRKVKGNYLVCECVLSGLYTEVQFCPHCFFADVVVVGFVTKYPRLARYIICNLAEEIFSVSPRLVGVVCTHISLTHVRASNIYCLRYRRCRVNSFWIYPRFI